MHSVYTGFMPHFPEAPPAAPIQPAQDFEAFRLAYRAALPIIGSCIYLNHASVGPLSDWVLDAGASQLEQQQMALTTSQDAWFDGWRLARQRVAELIGATRDEICIQPNTWAGLGRAFSALPLEAGDEVLFPADEFPTLYHALSELRVRGCEVRAVESARGDRIVRTEDLLGAITSRTRLVASSWVNFFHGYRHDLDALGEKCRQTGAWLVIDGIQGLGMLSLDVKRTGIHFFASQGAKWLCAPLGSGFLYASADIPPEITPRLQGWFAMELNHEQYTDRTVQPKTNANRFGGGTVPLASAYGLRRACEVYLEAGPQLAEQHALAHAGTLAAAAQSAGIRLLSDRSGAASAIVSLLLADCPDLPAALTSENIVFSVREGAVRLSPHWYLLDEEVAVAATVISRAGQR